MNLYLGDLKFGPAGLGWDEFVPGGFKIWS
jgi:hypothetical protein